MLGQQSLANPYQINTILQLHVTSPGPPYHPPSQQFTQPWGYRQESSIGVSLGHPVSLHQQGVAAPGIMLDVICKPSYSLYMTQLRYSLYLLKDILTFFAK